MIWKQAGDEITSSQVDKTALALKSMQIDLDPIISKLLARRGFTETKDLESLFGSKFNIQNLTKVFAQVGAAMEVIKSALKDKKHIIIYGDYDVDGITATAILWRFFYYELKHTPITPMLPIRHVDGYGVNYDKIYKEIVEKDLDDVVLITVDCGIKDYETFSKLKAKIAKLDIIVTDHHEIPSQSELEKLRTVALAVLHPDLFSKSSPISSQEKICGATVAWLFALALRERFIPERFAQAQQKYLELVALATVCDQMPITGINHKIVKAGMKRFLASEVVGLRELVASASEKQVQKIDTYTLGFLIGPRINAAGRISDPTIALRLLCTTSLVSAKNYADQLSKLNSNRQELTVNLMQDTSTLSATKDKIIVYREENINEGIIGLLAGKLSENTGKPAIVMTKKEDGNWVGSARSQAGINVTELIASQENLLLRFGGHENAAGLSVADENIELFIKNIKLFAENFLKDKKVEKIYFYDVKTEIEKIQPHLADQLEMLAPFGNSHEEPIFFLESVKFNTLNSIGKHLKVSIEGSQSEMIWFNYEQKAKLDSLRNTDLHDILVNIGYNEWKGSKSLQLRLRSYREGISPLAN